jgi:hypothetical protein
MLRPAIEIHKVFAGVNVAIYLGTAAVSGKYRTRQWSGQSQGGVQKHNANEANEGDLDYWAK